MQNTTMEKPPQHASASGDLPLRTMGIGAGVLLILLLIVAVCQPFPRVFARHGEDRKSPPLMPSEPNLLELAQKAEAGDTDAANTLAACYLDGRGGVLVDQEVGVMWLTKAANSGSGAAMNALGLLSFAGSGVPRSDDAAFDWFTKGAQKGNAQCKLNLAVCYGYGRGVPANRQTALHWLQEARDSGDAQVRRQALDDMRNLGFTTTPAP